jgi:chemotaxis family two-component system sensor kinase Cph1
MDGRGSRFSECARPAPRGARRLVLPILCIGAALTMGMFSRTATGAAAASDSHIAIADLGAEGSVSAVYTFVHDAFDTLDFQPRWQSESWSAGHKWLHIGSDGLIAAAYLLIAGAFVQNYRAHPAALLANVFWMLGVFFLAGGLTHLMDALMFWWPAYRLTALVKAATAVISLITAGKLVSLLPTAVAIRSPVQIQREIEQRRKTEMELRQVHVQLESIIEQRTAELAVKNQEMEQFLNTVSHDLKSPVVTCLGLTGMLREDLKAGKTEESVETVDRIERSATRMRRLIEDLLSLSRIGKVRFELADVDTDAMVRSIREEYAPRLAQIGAQIDIEGKLPTVHADAHWLTQVFENLLTNAIKYGCDNPNPRIVVSCAADGQEQRFAVRDNGKGIDAKYHSQIFEPFRRFRTDKEGSGMGLAIVARIVKMHGGRIGMESQAGKGTTFWIALPAGKPQQQAEAAPARPAAVAMTQPNLTGAAHAA